jgi:hypothetical protein
MDSISPLEPAEWEALVESMPAGSSQADVQVREKLFKELVVRADACPHARFKAKTSSFKGTLKLGDIAGPFEIILSRHGVSARSIDAILVVHGRAFLAAKQWVTGVSIMDEECCDMNQFHTFVIYITSYLSLWKLLLQSGCPGLEAGGNVAVDMPTFQRLLAALADPKSGAPWADISGFVASWKADPHAAFNDLVGSEGYVQFDSLAEQCIKAAVEAFTGPNESSENSCGARKRAFQLLQALNNMPSLPNAVPGPLKPSDFSTTEQEEVPEDGQKTSQWATSYREGFRLFTPREPQGLHAQSNRETQRDLQWRVFPIGTML